MAVHILRDHAVVERASFYAFIPDTSMSVIQTIKLYVIDSRACTVINVYDARSTNSATVVGNNAVLNGYILGGNLKSAGDLLTADHGSRRADRDGARCRTAVGGEPSARAFCKIRPGVGRPRQAARFDQTLCVQSTVWALAGKDTARNAIATRMSIFIGFPVTPINCIPEILGIGGGNVQVTEVHFLA